MTESEILEWALSKLVAAKQDKLFGALIIKFEAGKITRINTEKSEVPPKG